ncbi:glutathione S-transferase family protein [Thetidibacter halocola]|uniref:Glutathione S-transferase family protein n=1 Tax=Thetidibacter halocola TaxID=2827239 RepID=A0A8J7WCS3_9RHOB|nr:glutathione S-transferase family protein [Thetidibacter halocola]MBS0124064.1 glutathione S-transferase family protein [Thetidibacter halocola]
MLTLYAIPVSLYCAKTRIALRFKHLDWSEVPPPGGYGSAEYQRIVASGNLPALDHDGFLLADSEAIAEYLEEAFPMPPLLPKGAQDRARMRERGRFHDTRLEPALRALFGHLKPELRDADLTARQSVALGARLVQLARLLEDAPELPFGLGDCGYPVTFAWLDALAPRLDLAFDWPETVNAWRATLEAEPAVAAELAVYVPTLTRWLDGQGV